MSKQDEQAVVLCVSYASLCLFVHNVSVENTHINCIASKRQGSNQPTVWDRCNFIVIFIETKP